MVFIIHDIKSVPKIIINDMIKNKEKINKKL